MHRGPYAVPLECVHGRPLRDERGKLMSCPACTWDAGEEKRRRKLERQLRGTALGRLAGLK